MSDSPLDLDTLLAHWQRLTPADRAGVLKRMPTERRIELEQALATRKASAPQTPRNTNSEYAVYSPWLAEIVESCCENPASVASFTIKPEVCKVISRAHQSSDRPKDGAGRPSLLSLARTAILEGRLW